MFEPDGSIILDKDFVNPYEDGEGLVANGGPGSGNFGHAGRPGKVGGSSSGKGSGGGGSGKGPRKISNVNEAVEAILAGEEVALDRPKTVYTVLERLAKIAQDAKEKGEDAPNYDLCKVSVKGTNIFCASKLKTKENPNGIPRIKMPQIGGKPREGSKAEDFPRNPWDTSEVDGTQAFIEHMKQNGIKTTNDKMSVASLSASQAELVGPKVAKMMVDESFDIAKNPIFISNDGYIVDGHHRWAANVGRDASDGKLGDREMPVRVIDAPISTVLKMANDWAADVGLQPASAKETNAITKTDGISEVSVLTSKIGMPFNPEDLEDIDEVQL